MTRCEDFGPSQRSRFRKLYCALPKALRGLQVEAHWWTKFSPTALTCGCLPNPNLIG